MNLVCPHCRRSYPLDALMADRLRSVSTIVCARCKRSFPAGMQTLLEADLQSFEPMVMARNGAPITRSAQEIAQALEGVSFADLNEPDELSGDELEIDPEVEPAQALELALDVADVEVTSSGSFRLDQEAIDALIGELDLPGSARAEASPPADTQAGPAIGTQASPTGETPAGPAAAAAEAGAASAASPAAPVLASPAPSVPAVAAVLSRGAAAAREAVRQALGGRRAGSPPSATPTDPPAVPAPAATAAAPPLPEREPRIGNRPAPALSRGAAAAREAVRAALAGPRPPTFPRSGKTLVPAGMTTSSMPEGALPHRAEVPPASSSPAAAPEVASLSRRAAREPAAPLPPPAASPERAALPVALPAASLPVAPMAGASAAAPVGAPTRATTLPPQGVARIRRSWLDLAAMDLRGLINPAAPACEDLEWLLAWQQGPTRRGTNPSLPVIGHGPRALKP